MKAKLIKDFEDNGEFIFFPVGVSFKVLLKESCLLILSEFFLLLKMVHLVPMQIFPKN